VALTSPCRRTPPYPPTILSSCSSLAGIVWLLPDFPMDKRTSAEIARSYLTDSEAFLIAANVINRSGEVAASSPQYYLACHAIELILKAFILTNGGTESEIIKIRHDLLKAWGRANELGLRPLDTRIEVIIKMRAPYHLDHRFRYRQTGFITLPVQADLFQPIKALIHQIGPGVDRAMREEIKRKKGTP
jgi:hypothetical protein